MEWILESLWVWCSLTIKRHSIPLIITFSAKSSSFTVYNNVHSHGLNPIYLTNRKQFCRVNWVDAEIGDIEVGVPQGSCLDLLFLVYINDLPQAVQDSKLFVYADDTSLCYQSHDLTRLNEAINSNLRKLDTWLQQAFPECCENSFYAYFHQAETQTFSRVKMKT